MNELNLTELQFSEKDVKNFVNSSLDVEEGSILFIDNHDNNCLLYTSPSPRDPT